MGTVSHGFNEGLVEEYERITGRSRSLPTQDQLSPSNMGDYLLTGCEETARTRFLLAFSLLKSLLVDMDKKDIIERFDLFLYSWRCRIPKSAAISLLVESGIYEEFVVLILTGFPHAMDDIMRFLSQGESSTISLNEIRVQDLVLNHEALIKSVIGIDEMVAEYNSNIITRKVKVCGNLILNPSKALDMTRFQELVERIRKKTDGYEDMLKQEIEQCRFIADFSWAPFMKSIAREIVLLGFQGVVVNSFLNSSEVRHGNLEKLASLIMAVANCSALKEKNDMIKEIHSSEILRESKDTNLRLSALRHSLPRIDTKLRDFFVRLNSEDVYSVETQSRFLEFLLQDPRLTLEQTIQISILSPGLALTTKRLLSTNRDSLSLLFLYGRRNALQRVIEEEFIIIIFKNLHVQQYAGFAEILRCLTEEEALEIMTNVLNKGEIKNDIRVMKNSFVVLDYYFSLQASEPDFPKLETEAEVSKINALHFIFQLYIWTIQAKFFRMKIHSFPPFYDFFLKELENVANSLLSRLLVIETKDIVEKWAIKTASIQDYGGWYLNLHLERFLGPEERETVKNCSKTSSVIIGGEKEESKLLAYYLACGLSCVAEAVSWIFRFVDPSIQINQPLLRSLRLELRNPNDILLIFSSLILEELIYAMSAEELFRLLSDFMLKYLDAAIRLGFHNPSEFVNSTSQVEYEVLEYAGSVLLEVEPQQGIYAKISQILQKFMNTNDYEVILTKLFDISAILYSQLEECDPLFALLFEMAKRICNAHEPFLVESKGDVCRGSDTGKPGVDYIFEVLSVVSEEKRSAIMKTL